MMRPNRMALQQPAMGLQVDNLGLLGEFARPELQAMEKRDWRASLFDRLNPSADPNMSDADKERLGRAGLLQLSAGLLGTGGGFGNALAAGITGGQKAMAEGQEAQVSQQYKKMLAAQGASGGTAFMAEDMKARAAGHEPGSQGYKDWMRRTNGELARASSAGGQTFEMADENGVPTRYTFNPQTMKYEKAMLGGASAPAPAPQPDSGIDAAFQQFVQDASADAASRGEVAPSPQVLQTVYRQMAAGQPIQTESIVPRPITGRRKEDEARAVQAATEGVTLGNLPRRNVLEAQGAGMVQDARNTSDIAAYDRATKGVVDRETAVTTAKAGATSRAEAIAALPTALASADQTIAAIDKVLSHPGLAAGTGASATWDLRNRIGGTDAKNFNVAAAQVEGKAFLTAFESLRGGGAITEREGAAATAAIARLDRAQSASEYKAGLRELRGIAANAKMRAKSKAGQAASGGLSAAEQSELDQLRAKLGRK